jgi:surfeit locus 1 family protein
MNFRTSLAIVVGLAVAILCARLGFWQLARLHQKHAIRVALETAMNEPPIALGDSLAPLDRVRHRRVSAYGHYDESHELLLTGQIFDGTPGVEVLTPLVLARGSAVMVDRGWLASEDAVNARPQDFPESGLREVIGVADSIPTGIAGTPWRPLAGDETRAWSTHVLALDSLRARMPFAVASYVLHQLPAPGLPPRPRRQAPAPPDEGMHLSYAVQWFLFAAAALLGPPLVMLRRKPRP